MRPGSQTLPFPALVGLEAAQQALLLLAVEPALGGVAIAAPAGTGKSSLARGFADFLPKLHPESDDRRPRTDDRDGPHASAAWSVVGRRSSFVELPLGADEESLLGGLDLEATLRTGRRVARPGLLARADGGIIYVDQLNLLPDASANLLLAALESGVVRVEREGLSLRAAARFALIASYDPAEGAPRRHLLDRVGLLVVLPRASDATERAEVVRRNLAARGWGRGAAESSNGSPSVGTSNSSPQPLAPSPWDDELDVVRGLVAAAREQLADVRITDEQVRQLAATAFAFGVEGHRADLFAMRAACASAALALRDEVEQSDLELAVRLVILPRATRTPAPPEPQPNEEPPPTDTAETPPEEDSQKSELNTQELPEEQVLAALATELPAELDTLPFRAVRRGRTGSRGTTSGNRGRHIRSTPGDPRRRRVDVAATLRAAAPWQQIRGQGPEGRGQGSENRHPIPDPRSPIPDPRSLALRADDIRVKHYRTKAGALFLFAVDASGSMALHRMRQAKGAVHALLQKAYVHRDRVALLAFRGAGAQLLLPPSQSVELARRALDCLPTGGGTPLAAALLSAIEVARQARSRGIMQTVLVLLTDGRANVGLRTGEAGREAVSRELQTIGRHVAEAGIHAIVVDTQRSYLSRGEARKLAEWLSGEYIYLPNAQGEQIADVASDKVGR